MRETRPSGSEGGGTEINRLSLPLSQAPWTRLQRDSGCPREGTQRQVPAAANTDASISGVSLFVFVFCRLGW